MKRRSRKAAAREQKRRAKESPAYKLGGGESRYAKKIRGEVAVQSQPLAWCPRCYCKAGQCVCYSRAA